MSGEEHAQIGRIELRDGRLESALKRFDEAAASLPRDKKADWMFFRGVALHKAGRVDEAQAAWQRFELVTPAPTSPQRIADPIEPRHRFAAEAYLSLDMSKEGIQFFHRAIGEARNDRELLSATVVLCQLLLLADRREEYVEQVPDLLAVAGRCCPGAGVDRDGISRMVAITLFPLAVREFIEKLPERVVRQIAADAAQWPASADDIDFACRLVSRNCRRQLGELGLDGLTYHPARTRWNLTGEMNREFLQALRLTLMMQEALREQFGGAIVVHPGGRP